MAALNVTPTADAKPRHGTVAWRSALRSRRAPSNEGLSCASCRAVSSTVPSFSFRRAVARRSTLGGDGRPRVDRAPRASVRRLSDRSQAVIGESEQQTRRLPASRSSMMVCVDAEHTSSSDWLANAEADERLVARLARYLTRSQLTWASGRFPGVTMRILRVLEAIARSEVRPRRRY
jgi:hypothetical protein